MILGLCFLQLVSVRADSTYPNFVQPQVTISSISGETISFRTQNGEEVAGKLSQSHQIPHMVLFRNGVLTDPRERSLLIEVNGLPVTSSGAAIALEVSTQNTLQGQEQELSKNIIVWRETRWIPANPPNSVNVQSVQFKKVFKELLFIENQPIATPTDYFQIDICVTEIDHPLTDPLFHYRKQYAFLLENQWLVDLPGAARAAPSEVILYFYDMLPFHIGGNDPWSKYHRDEINDYLATKLIPAMQTAYSEESEAWNFHWHPQWRSYRPEDPPNRLSVALTDGSTWYHGQAHARGSGEISLRLDSEDNFRYKNLTDSLMSTFYHELFHNLQRSMNLNLGGDGDIDGLNDAWRFFSEGTAVLATSVGQSEIQFIRSPEIPVYFLEANGFFAGGGHVEQDLNRSYHEIDPYHAAIYWRFLYEKCGGMTHGSEDPMLGMQIIHNTLSVLYSKEIVDIQTSTDLVKYLPTIMDIAIQNTGLCPFENYQESLIQFSSALYSLQLESGRCVALGYPFGCELYDPEHRYLQIPIPEFDYSGTVMTLDSTEQAVPAGIKSSFGMDFLEINLARITQGTAFTIELNGARAGNAEFALSAIKIKDGRSKGAVIQNDGQVLINNNQNIVERGEYQAITIPEINLDEFDQLALIITRIDNREEIDSLGEYSIKLYPQAGNRSD